MRNFSLLGLLITVALIGWMAKGMFAPAVSHDPNDKSTVEYWVAHASDRATMLQYCNAHPQQQDTGECQLATAAQTQVDTQGANGGTSTTSGQPAQSSSSTDQNGGQASDQLQAQQDSNSMDPGGQ